MRYEEFESRLTTLEISMQAVLGRLKSLETAAVPPTPAPVSVAVTTPPVIRDQPPAPKPVQTSQAAAPMIPSHIVPVTTTPLPKTYAEAMAPKVPLPPQKDADEMEYKFGINGLLRGGAVVIVCAVLFLVAIGLNRGWITPTMQFVGELLLCGGFIGLGIWKQDEREEFGHLMTGIGSFGLYASFAGAHLFKHLITGETMVALFTCHSLINLGYSYWRASRSFLAIGMLGGLVTAILPLSKSNYPIDILIHFMTLVPAAVIIIRKRWLDMAVITWIASTAALLPLALSHFDITFRVGATYANAIIALIMIGKVYRDTDFDSSAALSTVVTLIGGVIAVSVDSGQKGSLHELLLGLAALAVGFLFSDNLKVRNATWFGAILVAGLLAPLGLGQNEALAVYSIEAICLAFMSLRIQWVGFISTGLLSFGFALVAYVWAPGLSYSHRPTLLLWQESLVLISSSITVLAYLALALRQKSKEVADLALVFGSLLLTAFFIRALNMSLGYRRTPLSTEDISSFGLAVASIASLAVARKMKRVGMTGFAFTLFTISTCVSFLRDPLAAPLWVSPMLLIINAVGAVMITRHLITNNEASVAEPLQFGCGLLLSAFFLRTSPILGGLHWFNLTSSTVPYLALVALSIFWTAMAYKRNQSYLILGWLSVLSVAVPAMHFAYAPENPAWLCPLMLTSSLVTLVAVYAATPRSDDAEAILDSILVIGVWALFTLLMKQLLTLPEIGLKQVATITVSWVTVAISIIAGGFLTNRRYLRYWSMAIFMITVGKVFLVDLAETDSMIRVVMLMALGLCMVAGGYWYIVWKRKNTLPKTP